MINSWNNACKSLATAVVVTLALLLHAGNSPADDVILDDQIVLGKQCVGVDCVNNEIFGLTTLRLKENNTRIFFQDTSSAADFPRNDWEILVNDSSNGGKNFLGFADRGEDVASASGTGICEGSVDNGQMCGLPGQATCLGSCSVTGFPDQACDATSGCPLGNCSVNSGNSGAICSSDGNCTNGGVCEFQACVNAGTCVPPGGVIFSLEAGAPNNSLVIDQNGRVGIGIGSPRRKLHVRGSARISGKLLVNAVQQSSSRAYKRDIQDLDMTAALDVLEDLQPVSYRLNEYPDESTLGFIAEDLPELVASDARDTVNPMEIVAVLTRALQAQQQLIENQRQEVIHLEGRIFDLEQALSGDEGGSK